MEIGGQYTFLRDYILQNEQCLSSSGKKGSHAVDGNLDADEIATFFSNSHVELGNSGTDGDDIITREEFEEWYKANEAAITKYYGDNYDYDDDKDVMWEAMIDFVGHMDDEGNLTHTMQYDEQSDYVQGENENAKVYLNRAKEKPSGNPSKDFMEARSRRSYINDNFQYTPFSPEGEYQTTYSEDSFKREYNYADSSNKIARAVVEYHSDSEEINNVTIYNKDGTQRYEEYENGKLVSVSIKDKNGDEIERYSLDSNNNILSVLAKGEKGNLHTLFNNEFDDNGKLTTSKHYDDNADLSERIEYKTADDGTEIYEKFDKDKKSLGLFNVKDDTPYEKSKQK